MIEIEVPFVAPSLNKWYAGNHWSKRKKEADLWHYTIWKLCIMDEIKPVKNYPVVIMTKSYFKSKRKRDTSNCFTANKMAEDAFVKAGILVDDTIEYVSNHIVEVPVFGVKENKTVIKIM